MFENEIGKMVGNGFGKKFLNIREGVPECREWVSGMFGSERGYGMFRKKFWNVREGVRNGLRNVGMNSGRVPECSGMGSGRCSGKGLRNAQEISSVMSVKRFEIENVRKVGVWIREGISGSQGRGSECQE